MFYIRSILYLFDRTSFKRFLFFWKVTLILQSVVTLQTVRLLLLMFYWKVQ